MEHIQRIIDMEQILTEGTAAIAQLSIAWEQYLAAEDRLQKLADYYTSPQWLADFDLERQGGLPAELPRGVLSEDGIWNLLADWDRIRKEIKEHWK